jgi:hypothetical protein
MNKMIRLLLMLLAFPLVVSAQFQFANVFPADSSASNSHGIVVDGDGNVWNAPYFSVLINEGAERINPVHIYDEDGAQLDFSPLIGTTTGDSLLRFGPITGVNKGADGNIYIASHGFRTTAAAEGSVIGGVWVSNTAFIHVINPETGEGIEVVEVKYMRTEAAAHAPNRPAVTEDGYVALSFVFPASPIVILDPNDDWNVLNTVTSDKTGFSRTLEVSADGSKIFNPNTNAYTEGGAPGHIQVYQADDVFSEYSIGMPLAIGTDPGSISRYPNSDLIFFSGAGSGNAPLGGALLAPNRYYGVNINNGATVTTFDWNYANETDPYKIPRGLAFSDDGQTAYASSFTNGIGAIQKYSLEGELNADVVSVRFMVNTATIPDTVRAGDLVQIRGVVNGAEQTNYFGQTINWGSGSVALQNAGGDYWSTNLTMAPGDELKYKIYTAKSVDGEMRDHTGGGWEGGDDKFFTVPEDASGTIDVPVIYYNRTAPFVAKEDSIALFFRVNVGAQVATGAFDPDRDLIGLRGDPVFDWGTTRLILDAETTPEGSRNVFYSGAIYVAEEMAGTPFKFKYVFGAADNINTGSISWDNGNDAFNPDGDGNNQAVIASSDSTYAFKFYEGRRPPTADVVQASLQFAVNVGVLEGLGFFNPAIDQVYTPGGFNNWDTSNTPSSFNNALGVWTSAVQIREEVGANVEYKYFIKWAESRFEEGSADYIPNLVAGNGWEEPGVTGGGNRTYTYTNETEQIVDDFGTGVAYFNSIPPQGVISETVGGESTMPVTFKVDMTPALTHTKPFNPATDKAYIMFETPFFALTQGLPIGDTQPIFDAGNEAALARVELTPVDGEPNMYSLTLDVALPTENHLGFTIFYVDAEGVRTGNGSGFSAGRRYYRYITPLDASDPDAIIWPDTYEVAEIVWKAPTTLDFEAPPQYGLGTSIDGGGFELPNEFTLFNNYPNPFNPSTNISFNLPSSEFVELSVFNVLGQKVATILSQQMTAGTHSVAFNARNLASGVYIYQIRAGSFVQNKTMMLVK